MAPHPSPLPRVRGRGGKNTHHGPPAFTNGNSTTVSDRDDVAIGATLRSNTTRETDGTLEVNAGDRLHLDVTIEFRAAVDRASIGIVVWDLARELYVYGASSDFVGIPLISACRGERRTFEIRLTNQAATPINIFGEAKSCGCDPTNDLPMICGSSAARISGFCRWRRMYACNAMKSSVLTAMTTPNAVTASGLAGYSPISAVGNGMND